MNEETRSARIDQLFESLFDAPDPGAALAAEPDAGIRAGAEDLWRHHLRAVQEGFLESGPSFEVAPVFQPGELLLGRFRIERVLGSGGMGEVYLAQDSRMNEPVALKTVARLLAASPFLRARFDAEVRNARRVTHANVCRIHELLEDGERSFFTMEYLEGQLLSDLIEALAPKDARLIIRQLAAGLDEAHRIGVIHGDFKPANVIVLPGPPPRAVITDFGLATVIGTAADNEDRKFSFRAGTLRCVDPITS